MKPPGVIAWLAHMALLSSVSFGGIPSVLPDVHNFATGAGGWVSDREFADYFAVAQAMPGPNMILMMSFIGWKLGGVPAAAASALVTFGPPCAMYFLAYRLWDRFREARWQRLVRAGLGPLTMGLIVGGGFVMARTGDTGWPAAAVTVAAALIVLRGRLNPLWILGAGAALGGAGLV